jgi:hypothetical protein
VYLRIGGIYKVKRVKFGEKFRSGFRRINTLQWNKCYSIKCQSDFLIDVLGDVVWSGTEKIRYVSYERMLEVGTQE